MADGLFGGAAFGFYPQLNRYRRGDPRDALNLPVDVTRGRFAGTMGTPTDIANFVRSPSPMEMFGDISYEPPAQLPYTTEHFLKELPMAPTSRLGQVAGQAASFAPMNPMPAVRGLQKVGGIVGEELAATLMGQRPGSMMSRVVPQPLFAVEPSLAQALGEAPTRQELLAKMQGLLGQKMGLSAGPELDAVNQEISALQQQFKQMPSVQRVSKEVVAPEITAPVSDIGFYSATEQAGQGLARQSGTGESFLNDLMKAPDVKKDELSWMGLDDYLKGKPNVTKQEVQDFIAANKVDVQERQLGATVTEDPIGIAKRKEVFDKYEPEIQALYKNIDQYETNIINARNLASKNETEAIAALNREGNPQPIPTADDWNRYYEAKAEMERVNKIPLDSRAFVRKLDALVNARDAEANKAYTIPEPTPTKYQKYQLPGGENYREILLTMPAASEDVQKLNQISMQLHGKPYTEIMADTSEMAKMRLAVKREYKNQFGESGQNAQDRGMYRSSHFDQPNILAHMRVNDRIDADGKKMLLVEEIQSDWHQAGREKGYKTKESLEKWYAQNKLDDDPSFADLNSEQRSVIERNRSAGMGGDNAVPDAPFKDTWYQLALKRLTKYAADNGYERIGLTTGRQQADRFNLAESFDAMNYKKNKDGTYAIAVKPKGEGIFQSDFGGTTLSSIPEKELPSIVGKELAQKIISGEGRQAASRKVLEGIDLQVGGEGMKKYYDEIYPKFLDKQAKKWNSKTGETRIKTGQGIPGGAPVRYIDITPEMKGGLAKGQPLHGLAAIPALPLATVDYSDPFQDSIR